MHLLVCLFTGYLTGVYLFAAYFRKVNTIFLITLANTEVSNSVKSFTLHIIQMHRTIYRTYIYMHIFIYSVLACICVRVHLCAASKDALLTALIS